jgi:hypothetical protein
MAFASLALVSTALVAVPDTHAQGFLRGKKEDLPKVQYFMARQQWTMVDDAPMINDQRTGFQSQQPGMAGNMQQRQRQLPKAGFQGYAPMPTFEGGGLPEVNNGVPRELPNISNRRGGLEATAGKLGKDKKGKKGSKTGSGGGSASSTTAKKPTSTTPKTYSPYKGYDPKAISAENSQSQVTPSNNGANQRVNTKVRGVLHWAHGK